MSNLKTNDWQMEGECIWCIPHMSESAPCNYNFNCLLLLIRQICYFSDKWSERENVPPIWSCYEDVRSQQFWDFNERGNIKLKLISDFDDIKVLILISHFLLYWFSYFNENKLSQQFWDFNERGNIHLKPIGYNDFDDKFIFSSCWWQ